MPGLLELCVIFALLSLVAFGGGNALLPELYRLVVIEHHWINSDVFAQLFALAQAAPGPNILVVSLIGLQLTNVMGFFALTLAFFLPTGIGMYAFTHWWEKQRGAPWQSIVQAVIGPLSVGLALSGGIFIAGSSASWHLDSPMLLITCISAAASLVLRKNPLWWIGLGALVGALDWV